MDVLLCPAQTSSISTEPAPFRKTKADPMAMRGAYNSLPIGDAARAVDYSGYGFGRVAFCLALG